MAALNADMRKKRRKMQILLLPNKHERKSNTSRSRMWNEKRGVVSSAAVLLCRRAAHMAARGRAATALQPHCLLERALRVSLRSPGIYGSGHESSTWTSDVLVMPTALTASVTASVIWTMFL